MTDLRNDLGKSDLPIIVGQLVEWNLTKRSYISEDTKYFNDMIKTVSSEGLTPLKNEKNPHFDVNSQILGKRYAEVARKLINK